MTHKEKGQPFLVVPSLHKIPLNNIIQLFIKTIILKIALSYL